MFLSGTGILGAGPAGTAVAIISGAFNDALVSFSTTPIPSYNVSFELGVDGGTIGSAGLGPVLASITFVAAQAVPEPDTAALALVGLLGTFANRRRISKRV